MTVKRYNLVYSVCQLFFLVPITVVLCADIQALQKFLSQYDSESALLQEKVQQTKWMYSVNITEENENASIIAEMKYDAFKLDWATKAEKLDWKDSEQDIVRQFSKITDIGTADANDPKKRKQLKTLIIRMMKIHDTAKVCLDSKQCLPLDPDLLEMMGSSRDYKKLLSIWKGWREVSGKKMKDDFKQLVDLSNEAIKAKNSTDNDLGDYWRSMYDGGTFEKDVEKLFQQIKPLYQQLHAYTKNKLKQIYGADKFPSSGHIPAHLLGNMWSQEWDNLLSILMPFKNTSGIDVTDELVKQAYTPKKMYQLGDDFFKSIGMKTMPKEFWDGSIIEKPKDGREFSCQAESYDFCNGKDFRVRDCANMTHSHLLTALHEMGHVQYYLQYKDQPVIFRDGANPGFHEAIADIVSLSFQTPKHLRKIGLLKSKTDDEEIELNFLMSMALVNIAFQPFGYLVDQWRWSVFRGDIKPDDYNKKWWDLRCKYQGVSYPVERHDTDFDPGSKYHVAANVPYIRYFVSGIITFQFLEKVCNVSGHVGPLHKCDFSGSTDAGKILSKMEKLGSSKPWPIAMEMLTDQKKMDARPFINYFKPLMDWLVKQNKGSDVTWKDECPEIGVKSETLTDNSLQNTSLHALLIVTIVFIFCFTQF